MLIAGKGYKNADVNVLLPNLLLNTCAGFNDSHGYAHQWYISSFEGFQDRFLLCDDPPVPSQPPKYGSYWAPERENNREGVAWLYSSISFNAKWNLYAVSQTPAAVSSSVQFLANTGISLAQAAKDQIIDFAQKTSAAIKVVAVNTYITASDVENYFVDKANHAVWKLLPYAINGFFELSLNSSAVLHSDINIPFDANAMRFSYEFVSADDGGVLEVFLDDNRIYAALSKDYVGQGQQNADWIDVSQFAGKHMKLSYRLSNAIEGRQGVVALDDLIFAHIESALAPIADTECLLNWAERNYPALFAPSGSPTAIWDVYTYRYYSATNAYVGVSSTDKHVYYMGADGKLLDEAPLADWLPKAGCQPPPPVDCLFNWAENNYPGLFAPSGAPTASWDVYTYRYYSATKAYVGVSSADNHVYYMGADGRLLDEGALSDWLPRAGCQ